MSVLAPFVERLLNFLQAWAICVIVVAFSGKFIGAAAMAKINGYSYRESGAVGALMCELHAGSLWRTTC